MMVQELHCLMNEGTSSESWFYPSQCPWGCLYQHCAPRQGLAPQCGHRAQISVHHIILPAGVR